MIHLRKNAFSETQIEIPFQEDELISALVDRVILTNGYDLNQGMVNHFQVLLNGNRVEKDLWPYLKVKEEDILLIAPIISGGAGGQLFKQIALITIAIAAAYVGQAYISNAAYAAAFTAGATIVGTLALNALIPPPSASLGGLGGPDSQAGDSQMYSISSQANVVKKFGFVPKVYGRHRMYPVVASNPYTEVETEPPQPGETKGKLAQYFYAIYDFGLGPLSIEDVKIGDTSILAYQDAQYRLVDLNKPSISEGPWDDVLFNGFQFYKGDVERDGTTVGIDKNQEEGANPIDHTFIRNAASNVEGASQEIVLDFVCQNGLISYGTDGTTAPRTISLDIKFSKVGEENWFPFNDTSKVFWSSASGGAESSSYRSDVGLYPPLNLSRTNYRDVSIVTKIHSYAKSWLIQYGYRKGESSISFGSNEALVGDDIYLGNIFLGKVVNKTTPSGQGVEYSDYILDRGLPINILIWEIREYESGPASGPYRVGTFTRQYSTVGGAIITGTSTSQVFATFKFAPREIAQYKVRVTRISSKSIKSYQIQDRLTLASLSSRFNRSPIITDKRHVFMEVRIKATNQLSGSIQNLNALTTSILDTWNETTSTWEKAPTRNPAWVFVDLLTGPINRKAMDKSKLHLPSILEWANFCLEVPTSPPGVTYTEPRFSSDFILDFNTTLQAMLNTLTSSYQASLNIVDGKYGVLIDRRRTTPVQVFTLRNSSSFSSQINYSEPPHALKVSYIDPDNNWNVGEVVIYSDGYDNTNATIYEDLPTFGCVVYNQAWRFGRYMLAQAKLRRETITLDVDFEYLVCTRGDYVQVAREEMKTGGTGSRVKSIVGNRIIIDDAIETSGILTYGYVFRSSTGVIDKGTVAVIEADTFDLTGPLPSVGDLIVIGETNKVVFDCMVKAINPKDGLTATLTLVQKADAIYDVESLGTIPDYQPNLNTNVDQAFLTPGPVTDLVVLENSWRMLGDTYQYYIDLDWEPPTGSAYDIFEIHVDNGDGYNFHAFTKETYYEYIANVNNLGVLHKFKVLAVSAAGKKLNLIDAPEVTAIPLKKVARPSDVQALYLNITNQVIQLDWKKVNDIDLKEYSIRYTPTVLGATWESSLPLMRVDRNTTMVSTQGRTGTYLIRAVDYNNNESTNSAMAITSIPNLFDLNVIDSTNDFPTLSGGYDSTAKRFDDTLVLQPVVSGGIDSNQYGPEGYYYYRNFLDLGEIYTVRLQSLIKAEGLTVGDIMSYWVTLDAVDSLSNSSHAQWDVEAQYRTTDKFNAISDWNTLTEINPMSEGEQDNWTEWKKILMGDATGRIFQFRLKLISNAPHVTPRVFDGVIKADMPDRLLSFNDLLAPIEGLQVNYTPEFKGPGVSPNIQITQDNAQSGDYYILENKNLNGFKITFYNLDSVAVARQFDVSVKGYGRKATAVI